MAVRAHALAAALVVVLAAGPVAARQNADAHGAGGAVEVAPQPQSAGKSAPRRKRPPRVAAAGPRELTIEQQNALSLLEGLVDKAKDIEDDATRVMVLTRLAEATFERDRDQARKMYRTAFDAVEDIDEASDGSASPIGTRTQLRAEVLESLYRLDPELAGKLAKTLDDDLDDIENFGMPFPSGSERGAALLRAAALLAPANPVLAADLGRQSLGHGVPFEFSGLLGTLSQSNRQLADELALDAVRSAARTAETPIDLWGIAPYLFPSLGGAGALDGGDGEPRGGAELTRSFLDVAFGVTSRFASETFVGSVAPGAGAAALDPLSAQEIAGSYALASQLAPMFDRFAPERAGAFRAALGQLERALPIDYVNRYNARPRDESPEALVERGNAETDQQAKATYYMRAAFLASHGGDYKLAKSILAKIEDEQLRESLMTPLASQAAFTAIDRRRYDEARRIALDVPKLETRAAVYTRLATAALRDDDRQRAVEALDDAERLLGKADVLATSDKASALVTVANAYARVDVVRGFEVMRNAVETVNKAKAREDVVPDANEAGAPGESGPALGYRMQLGRYDGSPGLEELSKTDYFRALSIAQAYDDRPLSILAQLAVVRGVMGQPPAPKQADRRVKPKAAPAAKPAPGSARIRQP